MFFLIKQYKFTSRSAGLDEFCQERIKLYSLLILYVNEISFVCFGGKCLRPIRLCTRVNRAKTGTKTDWPCEHRQIYVSEIRLV